MGEIGVIGKPILKSKCSGCGSRFWTPVYKHMLSPLQCKWYQYQHERIQCLCPSCGEELVEHSRRTLVRKIIASCIATVSLGFLVSLDRQETIQRYLAAGMVILPLLLNIWLPRIYVVRKSRQAS